MGKQDIDNMLRKPATDNFFSQVTDPCTCINNGNSVSILPVYPYTGCISAISFKLSAANR